MYKAIFLDMDGTLLNSKKDISERTKKILYKLMENGVYIILVSGRCNKSMEYIAKNRINKNIPIIRYIISTDGTMIKDIKEDKIIFQNSIDTKTVGNLIEMSKKLDTAFYIITENDMYKDNRDTKSQRKINKRYINTEFRNIENNLTTIDFDKFNDINEKVNRILFFSKQVQQLEKIKDMLSQNKEIQTLYGRSYENHQLLLVSQKYSKAMGVIEICNYLGIPVSQTVAFGDAENDIEMLKIAGKGVAMKNASENLGVNNITEYSNNKDGVARYLENMINNGEIF